MATFPSSEPLEGEQSTWQAIDRLLEQVAGQARQVCNPDRFFPLLLENLLPAMAADFAAVWLISRDRVARRYATSAESAHAAWISIEQVEQVVGSGQSRVLSVAQGDQHHAATAFLCPLVDDETVVGVLEVHQSPTVSGEIQQSYCELLSTFAELATDFHCRHQLRRLRCQRTNREQIDHFIRSIHQSLDLSQTCYAIANEGRRLVGCDRLSVLVHKRGQLSIQAISGLDQFDSRSEELCQLTRLVRATARTGEPLWFEGDASNQPPVIEELVQTYVDLSCTRAVAVLPLHQAPADQRSSAGCVGALVFERFDGRPFQPDERDLLADVSRHVEPSLRSAVKFNSLPLLWLSRLLQSGGWLLGGRRLPRSLLVVALTAALVASSLVIQTDFEIQCRGTLQPVARREIFAPSDGSIELRVGYGERVRPGDLLLVLHNPDLDYEHTRVLGEIQTTETQLLAVQASSVSSSRTDRDPRDVYQLGADEERLKELLRGLRRQRDVLQQQRQDLRIVSPIEGRVLTWNVKELLQSRPVRQGQKLLSVVDPDGPWELEVNVADHAIGHVLAARQDTSDLDVDFFLATDPAVVHQGTVRRVALSSETNAREGTSVRVTIAVDQSGLVQPRPGAGVVSKIHCGRRSVAYVWLHDVIDVIRTRILF